MSRMLLRFFVSLFALVLVFAVAAPAHAADPSPFGNLPAPAPLGQPLKATPMALPAAVIDYDISITASDSVTFTGYMAEGWLHLDLTTSGKGYFIDNLGAGKQYSASADAVAKTVTINTHYGLFVFDTTTGNAIKIPAKLGKDAKATFSSATHKYTEATNLDFQYIGYFNLGRVVKGKISFTYDAGGFMVPFTKTNGSKSGLTVTTASKVTFTPITAPGYIQSSAIFQMKLNGKQTTFVLTSSSSGIAVTAGDGAKGVIGIFSIGSTT